jgi:hypothetical protein
MVKKLTRAELLEEVDALYKRVAELERANASGQPPSELEWALRERVKELNCLYTISTLQETHFVPAERG